MTGSPEVGPRSQLVRAFRTIVFLSETNRRVNFHEPDVASEFRWHRRRGRAVSKRSIAYPSDGFGGPSISGCHGLLSRRSRGGETLKRSILRSGPISLIWRHTIN